MKKFGGKVFCGSAMEATQDDTCEDYEEEEEFDNNEGCN